MKHLTKLFALLIFGSLSVAQGMENEELDFFGPLQPISQNPHTVINNSDDTYGRTNLNLNAIETIEFNQVNQNLISNVFHADESFKGLITPLFGPIYIDRNVSFLVAILQNNQMYLTTTDAESENLAENLRNIRENIFETQIVDTMDANTRIFILSKAYQEDNHSEVEDLIAHLHDSYTHFHGDENEIDPQNLCVLKIPHGYNNPTLNFGVTDESGRSANAGFVIDFQNGIRKLG